MWCLVWMWWKGQNHRLLGSRLLVTCSGTTIDEGSGVAEGTKSLVPTDVEGDGGLETGRFDDVSWRSLSPFVSPAGMFSSTSYRICGWALVLY